MALIKNGGRTQLFVSLGRIYRLEISMVAGIKTWWRKFNRLLAIVSSIFTRERTNTMFQDIMKIIIIIIFVFAIITACYYVFESPRDSIPHTIAIGALASLIASLFYGLLMFFLVRESTEDKKRFLAYINEIEKRKLKGIRHIRAKSEFAPEFWISLVNTAATGLDIGGHALSQWCEEPYRSHFISSLKRVAENGKVRILLMKPDGEAHQRRLGLTGVSYAERIQTTLSTIQDEVLAKVNSSLRKNITMKWTGNNDFHNVFIRTDSTVLVSPYLATMSSRDAIQLVLDPKEQFGSMYLNDFDKLFNLSEEI